jgi:hypothetical protein
MMGLDAKHPRSADPELKGLIPRLCAALFERIATTKATAEGLCAAGSPGQGKGNRRGSMSGPNVTYSVQASSLESYTEQVRDLLRDVQYNHLGIELPADKALKVREHPKRGPYVENLLTFAVMSYEDVSRLLDRGQSQRMVGSTQMNAESSRSHSVFSLHFMQTRIEGMAATDRTSVISMVDLAGSEKADKTGATGVRLREASNINRSLSALGHVINTLADGKMKLVPYRNSMLTWILKESLGGNARTTMVANVSPSSLQVREALPQHCWYITH